MSEWFTREPSWFIGSYREGVNVYILFIVVVFCLTFDNTGHMDAYSMELFFIIKLYITKGGGPIVFISINRIMF